MLKSKALLLTQGMHGMISQVEGLAKALDLDYFHEKVELNSPWNLVPPSLTPKKKFIFKHGKTQLLPNGLIILSSYHPSPRNVNTKLITNKMMVNLFKKAKKLAKF